MLSLAPIKQSMKFFAIVIMAFASNGLFASTSGEIYEESVKQIAHKISEGQLEEALKLSRRCINGYEWRTF